MSSDSVLEAKRCWEAEQSEEAKERYLSALRRSGDHHALARAIMGKNFLGLREVSQYFCLLRTDQISALAAIPFSEETLHACAESHILVADIGLSIVDLFLNLRTGVFLYFMDEEFLGEIYTQETDKACWRLIRKNPVDSSECNTWSDQKELVANMDETPSARQVVYMMILNFLTTGERLFKRGEVRTSSVSSSSNLVTVGEFDRDTLRINEFNIYASCNPDLGVASAVRPQQPLIASR